MYKSIEKNMRGFTYCRRWDTINDFWIGMQLNIDEENNEIEWSKLIEIETGHIAGEYNRGCEIPEC